MITLQWLYIFAGLTFAAFSEPGCTPRRLSRK